MARYFEKISEKDLLSKINEALTAHEEYTPSPNDPTLKDAISFYNSCLLNTLTKTVEKDVGKVHFDTENVEIDSKCNFYRAKLGLNTLSNGMSFFGVIAGGDWEVPVYFIIYWDGKKLRGYVPEEGNPWNKKTKEAYGNNEKKDMEDAKKRFNLDDDDGYCDLDSLSDKRDWNLIEKDIMQRIEAKI